MNSFVISSVGGLVRGDPSKPVRVRDKIDPCAAVPWCVAHPPDGNYRTFGLEALADGSHAVAGAVLPGCFDSPHKRNLLYFGRPAAANALLLVDERGELLGGTPLWYAREPAVADLPAGPAVAGGPLHRQFYRQRDRQPDGPFERAVVRARPHVRPDGWMNPPLFRLDLDGRELGADDPGMRPFADPAGVLFVQPLHGPEDDARALFWAELLADRRRSRSTPSVIETLVVGPDGCGEQLQTFQALDALGGLFLIDGRGPADYAWCPPALAPGSNAEWYARYWLARWHGRGADAPAADVFARAVPGDEPVGGRSTHRIDVPADRVSACTDSAAALLGCGPASADPADPQRLLLALLARPELRGGPADRCHRGHFDLDHDGSRVTARVDTVGLIDRFARRHVLPRSRLWVALPSDPAVTGGHPAAVRQAAAAVGRALAGGYFDPTALPLGGYDVFRRLAAGFAPVAPPPLAPSPQLWGWWADWFDWLFRAAPADRFALRVPDTGLVLGRSPLGAAPVGWSGAPVTQARHVAL